jgi:hypothetical protein
MLEDSTVSASSDTEYYLGFFMWNDDEGHLAQELFPHD